MLAGGWDRGKRIINQPNLDPGWQFVASGPTDRRVNAAWAPSNDPAVALIKSEGMKAAYEASMVALEKKYLGGSAAAGGSGHGARSASARPAALGSTGRHGGTAGGIGPVPPMRPYSAISTSAPAPRDVFGVRERQADVASVLALQ